MQHMKHKKSTEDWNGKTSGVECTCTLMGGATRMATWPHLEGAAAISGFGHRTFCTHMLQN